MATQYTSLLGLALPVTGELSGNWGSVVNDSITSLIDSSVAGTTTLNTDADVTLSTTTGAANQARQAIILWTANGTTTRNITAPAQSKAYVVINKSAGTQSIVFRGVGPTTGVTIAKDEAALVAWNGSDFIKISNINGAGQFTDLDVTGTTTLDALTASTALALNASKEIVSVTNTGTGNNVLATSPTLITPNLGTPSAVTLTNATGLPVSTGISGLGSGVATFLATPSSANLAAAVTDETGSGALVFATSPSLTTPTLGAATATSINKVAITAPATSATLTIANGKTLTANNSLTLAGTDATTMTFPSTSATIARTDAAQTFTGTQTFSGAVSVQGNTTLGDASTDTVTVNGYMGVGGAGSSDIGIRVSHSNLTTTSQSGVYSSPVGTVAGTLRVRAFSSLPSSAASAYTVGDVVGYWASNAIKGAGSTITNQHGLYIADQTQGTNNYGITSLVSSGTNKWNIYASGTAANYFAGNVGIGTSSPGAKLQSIPGNSVNAVAALFTSGASDPNFRAGFANGSGAANDTEQAKIGMWYGATQAPVCHIGLLRGGSANSSGLTFNVNNTERMRIDSSGNVGIGTSSPRSGLDVYGVATIGSGNPPTLNMYRDVLLASGSSAGRIYFGGRYDATNYANGAEIGSLTAGAWSSTNHGTALLFSTTATSSTTPTERMRITSAGNVGIGTSSPGGVLDVIGQTIVRGTSGTPTGSLKIFGYSAATDGAFSINSTATRSLTFKDEYSGVERLRIDSSGALIAKPAAGTGAVFNEDGVDADFRVESDTNTHALFVQGSDGNVGIGTSSPIYDFQIGAYGVDANSTLALASTTTGTCSIRFGDGTSGAEANAGLIQYDHSVNAMAFATLNGTERLRITSAGNVSIGGTDNRATTVGTAALNIFNGTAPVGTLTNGISIYSSSGEAYVMDAAGNATLFSPHDAETNEWIFKSKHTPTGKVLRIDVEKLLRFVNDHFGLDAVQEFIEP